MFRIPVGTTRGSGHDGCANVKCEVLKNEVTFKYGTGTVRTYHWTNVWR